MDATDRGLLETRYYGCCVVDLYNEHRMQGVRGAPPTPSPDPDNPRASLRAYRWQTHCRGLYHTPRAA